MGVLTKMHGNKKVLTNIVMMQFFRKIANLLQIFLFLFFKISYVHKYVNVLCLTKIESSCLLLTLPCTTNKVRPAFFFSPIHFICLCQTSHLHRPKPIGIFQELYYLLQAEITSGQYLR